MGGAKWNKSTFTIFDMSWNPQTAVDNCSDLNFIICQKEKCPSSGKLHWQGYYECKTRKGIKGHQTNLCAPKCHIEMAKGSADDNIIYCSKSESKISETFRYGNPVTQGQRKDLIAIKDDIMNGMSLRELAEKHFEQYIRYHKGIEKYYDLINYKERTWKTKLIIFVGPSRCGKTSHILKEYPDLYRLMRPQNTVWFDGYNNHNTILIDEFYGWIPFDMLLNLTDHAKMTVEVKGGTKPMVANTIYITSNDVPEKWYPNISNLPHRWEAFKLRIDEYYNFYDKTVYKKPIDDDLSHLIPISSLKETDQLVLGSDNGPSAHYPDPELLDHFAA